MSEITKATTTIIPNETNTLETLEEILNNLNVNLCDHCDKEIAAALKERK